jgi:hypothetical protein
LKGIIDWHAKRGTWFGVISIVCLPTMYKFPTKVGIEMFGCLHSIKLLSPNLGYSKFGKLLNAAKNPGQAFFWSHNTYGKNQNLSCGNIVDKKTIFWNVFWNFCTISN